MTAPFDEFRSIKSEDVDVAECWREIEAVAYLLSNPGQIQVQCAKDPEFGPLISASTTKMLTIMVAITDFECQISEEDQVQLSNLATESADIYSKFLARRMARAGGFMQMLPVDSLFVDMRPATNIDGVNANDLKDLTEQAARITGRDQSEIIAAKFKPSLNAILNAGISAAGGQAEFARLQMSVLSILPEEVKKHTNLMMTAQFIGATVKALTDFARQREMALVSILGPLESIMAARRMCGLGFAGTWGESPKLTVSLITSMINFAVSKTFSEEGESSAKAATDEIIENLMKSANHPGNGTVN